MIWKIIKIILSLIGVLLSSAVAGLIIGMATLFRTIFW